MFLTLVAGAGGFAAGEELLDVGPPEQSGRGAQLAEEGLAAQAQGEGGFALEFECPSHIYGKDTRKRLAGKRKRKCPLNPKMLSGALSSCNHRRWIRTAQ